MEEGDVGAKHGATCKHNDDKDNIGRKGCKKHTQAIGYARLVLATMTAKGPESEHPSLNSKKCFSRLTDAVKAEIALVIFLVTHMNRVSKAILGEGLRTDELFLAADVTRGFRCSIARFVPIIGCNTCEAGKTSSLFPEEDNDDDLSVATSDHSSIIASFSPVAPHLQGVFLTGLERALAMARVKDWVGQYGKEKLLGQSIVSKKILKRLLEDPSTTPPPTCTTDECIWEWAENTVQRRIGSKDKLNDANRAIGMVLLLVTFAPHTVHESQHWLTMVKCVGDDMARCIVVWWSLKLAFRDAKGLDSAIDAEAMFRVIHQ
ncbi:expressed unknown protein [Seminavis robusta]|uniref:Uncharacterized protein n=1 Tax=Seminavis robusta TaxID=568900 RepID=A0A9N8EJH9_9STRA|nr:expressed unknown protein [Seminavis robusta]|eukprot:Sro1033_g233650.1 n/a (319) ;mRNA; f:6834-7790